MDKYLKTQVIGQDCIIRMCGLVNELTKPVKIVFDIGAADGTYSQLFGQQFPFAKIYAFEPHPESYKKLCKVKGIIPFRTAFSDKKEITTLYSGEDFDSSSLVPEPDLSKKHEILTNTLDSFCERFKIDHIDFMKIDAEGSEPKILEGGLETLLNTDNLFIEIQYIRRGLGYMRDILKILDNSPGNGSVPPFKLVYCSEDGNFFFTRLWK